MKNDAFFFQSSRLISQEGGAVDTFRLVFYATFAGQTNCSVYFCNDSFDLSDVQFDHDKVFG